MDNPRTYAQLSSGPDSEREPHPTPRSIRLAMELQMDADSSFRAGVEAIRNSSSGSALSAGRVPYCASRTTRVPQRLQQSYLEHEGW